MADIPGIIEGASKGKGLGFRFLRHIERNSVLLFMVPADTSRSIKEEYEILKNELQQYNSELMQKPHLLAVTKADMLDDELKEEMRKELPNVPALFISSVAQQGIAELKDMLWKAINEEA
jgi:GTP-binding protein